MEQFGTVSQFTQFVSEKPYIHLSEDLCVSIEAFIHAEGLNVLEVLRYAGEYLVQHGDEKKTYELIFTHQNGVTKLREYQTLEHNQEDKKMKLVAQFLDPYWVFLIDYEL